MYNDEIFDALEDAYDDSYMYDEAYEDVDMFDDNYFEAMEGPAREYRHKQNEGKSREQIRKERRNYYDIKDDNRNLYSSDRNRSSSRESNKNRLPRAFWESDRDMSLKYNRGHGVKNRYSSNNVSHNIDVHSKRVAAIDRDYKQGKITKAQYDKLRDANKADLDKYIGSNSGVNKIHDSIRQRRY